MKKLTNLIGLMAAYVFALVQPNDGRAADANPPERMTYQGYLVDGNGDPLGNSVPANYDVIFRIYKAKSGGEPIWSEQQTVTVDKGYFSILLGEGSSFGNEPRSEQISTAFVGADISDRFIGITVGGLGGVDLEIAPRLRLVASPFAFTATQARNVSDGSGNRNLFREVDSSNNASLKLGAGSTPTLTLQEAGDATLAGKLTIDLPAAGVGLEIKEQGTSTKFGGLVGNRFSMSTGRGGFHFDKSIYVDGDIYSFNRDARIYPSDNADNFLNVNHDGDTIDAYTDKFYVRDHGVSYLEIDPTSSALNLSTDAASFYMNRSLETAGVLIATGNYVNLYGNSPTMQYYDSDGEDYWIHVNGDRMYFIHGTENGWHSDRPLTIDKNKIGINRTSPSHALDVSGSIRAYTGSSSLPGLIIDRYPSGNYRSELVQASDGLAIRVGNGSTEPAEKMRIKHDGYVGIGTGSPSTYLHVGIGRDAAANSSGLGSFMIGSRSGDHMRIDNNEIMAVNNNSTSTLYLNANGGTVRSGSSTVTSDQRLKHNIHPIKYGLSELRKLKPVSYDWKLDLFNLPGTQLGFIAQDVQKVLPELVTVGENSEESRFKDELALNVNGILPVVVASVQALDKENRQLKSDLETLKSEMAVLKARLANSTTQENRIAKLEELVSKIGQGQ